MHESPPRRYFRVLSTSHEIAESPGTVKVAGAFVLPIKEYPRMSSRSRRIRGLPVQESKKLRKRIKRNMKTSGKNEKQTREIKNAPAGYARAFFISPDGASGASQRREWHLGMLFFYDILPALLVWLQILQKHTEVILFCRVSAKPSHIAHVGMRSRSHTKP